MSHPSVFTLHDLRTWDSDSALRPTAMVLAVLGDPVAHSASPPMHNAALRHHGLPFEYIRLHISPEELSESLTLLKRLHFLGVNLTIPHKAAVLDSLDRIDSHAMSLGVVNTVAFRDGVSIGFNTDGPGLARAIENDFNTSLHACRVLITGAGGGAGRAVALQCGMEQCPSIVLVNRTLSKAQALAEEIRKLARSRGNGEVELQIECFGDQDPHLADTLQKIDLILQCSSVGMRAEDPSPLPASALHSGLRIYDTIYSRKTQLLQDAETAGAQHSNGLSMLLYQGALAFEIWFQRPAPLDVMKTALQSAVPR
jgi:shikimate dehydrogenase